MTTWEISVPISDGLTLLHFGFNHEKFTPPPLRETTQKSKIVFFSQGRTPNNLKFNFNGKQLEIVDEFNYLGVLLTKHANFYKSKMLALHKGTKVVYFCVHTWIE